MASSGHGLPTPRLIRSASFVQCVVAVPNLSLTKCSVHASRNESGCRLRLVRFSTSVRCLRVGSTPYFSKSTNASIARSSAKRRTSSLSFDCSAAPRVTRMPAEIAPSACSRLKFSRSRSKKGSLLFHSISSANSEVVQEYGACVRVEFDLIAIRAQRLEDIRLSHDPGAQPPFALSRSTNFWIFPVLVFGTSPNTTWRGHL